MPRGTIVVADIFISYSQADRDKVVMLSAYLESEGWTVWWDKNLSAGEPYRDEIVRELAAARAVIVLWTPTSIKSDFVRAEAGRAKADGKLIPVKIDEVGYGDIPLPFGEMHTESLANKELIRVAIAAQLAKPAVQAGAVWVASRILRYQVLTWFGVIGGAITVFSGLRGVLDLAAWANWIVSHWQAWTQMLWQWLFTLLQIGLPPYWAPLLTFSSFAIMVAIGQRVQYLAARKVYPESALPDTPAIGLKHMAVLAVLPIFASSLAYIMLMSDAITHWIRDSDYLAILIVLSFVSLLLIPLLLLIYVSRRRTQCAINVTIVIVLYSIIAGVPLFLKPLVSPDWVFGVAFLCSISFFPVIMLSIAPINALTKRLMFLVLGIVMLVGLNEISKHADAMRTILKLPSK
jgi:hypothetical protein